MRGSGISILGSKYVHHPFSGRHHSMDGCRSECCQSFHVLCSGRQTSQSNASGKLCQNGTIQFIGRSEICPTVTAGLHGPDAVQCLLWRGDAELRSLHPPRLAVTRSEMLTRCPACRTPLALIRTITAFHYTGDERAITLSDCPGCGQSWIQDSVEAWLDRGTESVKRAFGPIERGDSDRLATAFAACPEPGSKYCECGANKIADAIIARVPLVAQQVEPG